MFSVPDCAGAAPGAFEETRDWAVGVATQARRQEASRLDQSVGITKERGRYLTVVSNPVEIADPLCPQAITSLLGKDPGIAPSREEDGEYGPS